MKIGRWFYSHGHVEAHPNRKLEFFRQKHTHNVIGNAFVYDQSTRGWTPNGNVVDIQYEPLPTTQKMERMMAARQANQRYQLPFPVPISNLHRKEIDQVFRSLEPDGPYRLAITNGIGNNTKYENVEKITIFNPS